MSARRKKPLRPTNALRGFRAGWRCVVAVLLAGFSLLVQALLPWPADATARAERTRAPGWVMASLCLAHDPASPARPVKPDPGNPSSGCAICLALHCLGAFVPPHVAALHLPQAARGIELAAWTLAEPGDAFRTASQARAPPATV
jgi:hypothetical protein